MRASLKTWFIETKNKRIAHKFISSGSSGSFNCQFSLKMTVCKFFLKGYCRYGRDCRFEHPGEDDYSSNYSTNHQSSPINFSFKTPVSANIQSQSSFSFSRNYQTSSPVNSTGFSFKQPPASTSFSLSQNVAQNDVDMSEGFSFRQSNPLGSIFQPSPQQQPTLAQNTLPQNNSSIFAPTNLQQPILQSPFSFQQTQVRQQPISEPVNLVTSPSNSFGNLNNNTAQPQQDTIKTVFVKQSEYTEESQLTYEELEEFKSNKFSYRRIPVRPPPRALC